MSVTDPFDTVREALYAATRGPDLSLAPVPGTPVGDAHLALASIEERLAADERNLCNCRELLKQALDAERMVKERSEVYRTALEMIRDKRSEGGSKLISGREAEAIAFAALQESDGAELADSSDLSRAPIAGVSPSVFVGVPISIQALQTANPETFKAALGELVYDVALTKVATSEQARTPVAIEERLREAESELAQWRDSIATEALRDRAEAAEREAKTLREALREIANRTHPATYLGKREDGVEMYGGSDDAARFARAALASGKNDLPYPSRHGSSLYDHSPDSGKAKPKEDT